MNLRLLSVLFLAVGALSFTDLAAEEKGAALELKALVTSIQTKLRAGQRSASDLAPELATFDALRAKYGSQRSEDVARIMFAQASLYRDVLDDTDRAIAILKEIERMFAGTPAGDYATAELEAMARRVKMLAAQKELLGKPAPEITFAWSTREGLKKLSDLRGKVVVLDFWATWCGPCVATFPQIRELVEHYKDADVAVVGVTSVQGHVSGLEPQRIDTRGNPQKEFALMKDYIKAKDITWHVVFSEENVFNPDYGVQGIPHMAIVAPDGTLRHNALHPGMPHAEKLAKINALLTEFGKRVP